MLDISVLYSDSSLIVCEKPVGISSESPGLPDLLQEQLGKQVWPVHRLDQGTGGCILLAFSAESCSVLQRLFQESRIGKEYLAVISGCPTEMSGHWEDMLWHDRKSNKSYVVNRMRAGVRKAECEWNLLKTCHRDENVLSLVRVCLHTGRTHQIRVQFSTRGFPLVGDRKYGSRISSGTVALWSSGISFEHPQKKIGSISVRSVPSSVFPWDSFTFED